MFSYSINPIDDTHKDFGNVQDDEGNLDEDEDEDEDMIDFMGLTNAQPLWVLPLYSLLPEHEQVKVNILYNKLIGSFSLFFEMLTNL